ncbi:WD40 repeat [Dillenia turbinata]|uniref:Serine/threonine-protein phosphatase 2A 55 kDa regulatory subunit B n=1 Tax=Dillenia turbinata TaxID=194707 RepID=A0AAN8US01_9MAGN
MSSNSESNPSPFDWKFSQVFGDRSPGEDVQDIDIISSIEFQKSGDYLAIGDRGGRVVIFENKDGKDISNQRHLRAELEQFDFTPKQHPKFQYKTEFQSHEPESLEIEEKINKVRWTSTSNGSQFLLSTNDKTIKLWKVKEHKVKKVKEMDPNPFVSSENSLLAERSFVNEQQVPSVPNGYRLEWTEKVAKSWTLSQEGQTKVASVGDAAYARCRKVYAHAHDFNINSISHNSDGETFISADDLRINLWNLEIKVITAGEFHPLHCNLLAYSSSRGFIRLVDMRQSALCDHNAKIIHDAECCGSKSLFTEIIASISDIKFSSDGRHILSRDYMNLKLWDLNMETSPVVTYKIHEHLRPKLCDFNLLRTFLYGNGAEGGITMEVSKSPNRKPNLQAARRARRSSISNITRGFYRQGHDNSSSGSNEHSCNFSSKILHLAWHPTSDFIACAAGNSLFLYHA